MAHNNTAMDILPPVTEYAFDPVSLGVLQREIPGSHMSHQQLKTVIDSSTTQVTRTCESNRVSMRNGLSYDQFLAGMLYSDEQLLGTGRLISYTDVVFQQVAETGITPVIKQNMTRGRLFVTNHRILLLSAEQSQGVSIASTGISAQDKRPKSYLLTGRCSDVLHYQTLPLGCIKSVELNASVGVTSSTDITGRRPVCILAMWGCCGMDACLKSWYNEPVMTVNLNQRILTLGVTLPPWGHKCMVQIHIDPTVPLNLVKEFIVDIQHFAPDLYTGAMTRKE